MEEKGFFSGATQARQTADPLSAAVSRFSLRSQREEILGERQVPEWLVDDRNATVTSKKKAPLYRLTAKVCRRLIPEGCGRSNLGADGLQSL